MTAVERVKKILKERKIPVSRMEKDLGFSNGYIGQLKKGTLPADRLDAIAKYLKVDSEYLLYGDEWYSSGAAATSDEEDVALYFDEELQIMIDQPETRSLLRSSKGLTKDQIRMVSEIMRNLRRGKIDDDS